MCKVWLVVDIHNHPLLLEQSANILKMFRRLIFYNPSQSSAYSGTPFILIQEADSLSCVALRINMYHHALSPVYYTYTYLSLLFLCGWTIWTEKVLLIEVMASQLFGLDVPYGLIANWYPSESLNLHPAHEILSSKVLVQENL